MKLKQLLSVLLACLLCLGCGVGAAAIPVYNEIGATEAMFEGTFKGIFETQSMPPLRTVTHIEAQFNGEVRFNTSNFSPHFSSINVTVTLYFEDDEPEVLDGWSGESWIVYPALNSAAGKVTMYYDDMNLREANPGLDYYGDEYRALLPQASFDYPENYCAFILERRLPYIALKPGETYMIEGMGNVFTFTPDRDGAYRFEPGERALTYLFNSDLNLLAASYYAIDLNLRAGVSYFVFTRHETDDHVYSFTAEYISPLRLFREQLQSLSSPIRDFFGAFGWFGLMALIPFLLFGVLVFPFFMILHFLGIY